jgi:hypothetical protein
MDGMRLPQSSLRPLSVYKVHILTIGIVSAILGILPVSAGATVPQLACTPSSLRFGDVIVGQTESLMVSVTNNGQTSVTVTAITASKTQFAVSNVSLPFTLPAGQSAELSVSYAPTVLGWTGGTVKLTSTASNATLVVDVGGTGVNSEALTAAPSTVAFGQVATGSSAILPLVLTNNRTWKVTLSAATIAGNGFSISGLSFPLTLSAGQSATLNVTFAPKSAGTDGGSIFFSGVAQTIPLTGLATSPGQLTIAPAPLNFGSVPEKTTETLPITVSASGGTVTVSSASSSSSQFVLKGASFPFTLTAGQSEALNVAFTPQGSGTISGSLSFASNASNSQAAESLSGIGTVTPASVSLFWNSSTEAVGYNVYRSTAVNGTYSKINPSLEANTAYTDGTVSSGQTYYYEATSVNSAGQESARSTPAVQAAVP